MRMQYMSDGEAFFWIALLCGLSLICLIIGALK